MSVGGCCHQQSIESSNGSYDRLCRVDARRNECKDITRNCALTSRLPSQFCTAGGRALKETVKRSDDRRGAH
jgi:hypothetical protein